jgi:hypothetical protein
VEWAVVENNRFIESEIFYPGTSVGADHVIIRNNYFKRTGVVQSGVLDIGSSSEEVFVLDNVIDASGVTSKTVNPDWYYIIDAGAAKNGIIRGNTIVFPTANPADRVSGISAVGSVKGVWMIEGNKFISNLTRGASPVGQYGIELFDNAAAGPYFLISGNYFLDFNVNQGGALDNDFSIMASGSYPSNVVVRNNIHKNCNRAYYPLSGMNVSGDVTYA